ncbi:MAG: cold shock CspA family protein [Cycloclasticus pugetii]
MLKELPIQENQFDSLTPLFNQQIISALATLMKNMKFQGKVLNWNDEKGFGFVEPNGGGKRAFVHIKAFKPRSRRPVNGEIIVYELVQDNNNRYKAENIQFARDARHLKKRSQAKKRQSLG